MSGEKSYQFQTRITESLLSGRNVVLQAPTGSGKTRAAVMPFIHAIRSETDINFPRKCTYIVPMRVLANQFYKEYAHCADKYSRRFRQEISVKIQTGEHAQDPHFQADLTFCTIDQFLASYLTMPLSISRRKANMNAGAFIGSYLVFDEFHLFDPGSTLPTTLYILNKLKTTNPILLMTATFSQTMLHNLADLLDAEVITLPEDELHEVQSRAGTKIPQKRFWHVTSDYLDAESVLKKHEGRTLVICNQVQRAQQLFFEIQKRLEQAGNSSRLILLHSRFLPEDRKRIEQELAEIFGSDERLADDAILIATQTVEVGVDITCTTMHTELAPASSLIQRAGRCARFPGETGNVFIYPVESFRPYGNNPKENTTPDAWTTDMMATYEWIQVHQGEVMDFEHEQALINSVASARDCRIIEVVRAGMMVRQSKIHAVLNGEQDAKARRILVRNADSRRVLIHHDPDELLSSPFHAEGFSLPLSTLFGMFRGWQERDIDSDWRILRLVEDTLRESDSGDTNQVEYGWLPLHSSELLPLSQVIVIHPELAGYSEKIGFLPNQGGLEFRSSIPPFSTTTNWQTWDYALETYEDHVRHVMHALSNGIQQEMDYGMSNLEQKAGWQTGSLIKACRLVCLFHDVGKLDREWQAWAQEYQKLIQHPIKSGCAVAHTEHEAGNKAHWLACREADRTHPRPSHAAQSAVAVAAILKNCLDSNESLTRAAITAISRHHSPFLSQCKPYHLIQESLEIIRRTLTYLPEGRKKSILLDELCVEELHVDSFSQIIIQPEDAYGWMAYTILVRVLRFADQEGTAAGTREVLRCTNPSTT